ncbi:MAG: hypothetical protein U0790_25425 [Isosphaeraceae bacterium]
MTETATEFFEAWSLYDQLLDHNYMYHDELFAGVHSILAERFGDRPIAVLDLGCGSARHAASALAGRRGRPLCRLRPLDARGSIMPGRTSPR